MRNENPPQRDGEASPTPLAQYSNALPRLMLITQRDLMQPSWESALRAALEGGARLVQLREKSQDAVGELELAQTAQLLCRRFGARLQINTGDTELSGEVARAVGTGVHLPQSALRDGFCVAGALAPGALRGASVHDVSTAQTAWRAGIDYLVFGSVFPTATHRGEPVAGLDQLGTVVAATPLPVFAVGGITPQNCALCRSAGAHGVAVIRAVWSAPDTAAAVRAFSERLGVDATAFGDAVLL